MTEDATYRVGDRVRVRLGSRTVSAEVLENLGPLGKSGERVLRVGWVPTDSDERIEFDAPESRLMQEGLRFEEDVGRILERLSATVERPAETCEGPAPDFVVTTHAGDQIVVDAKSISGGSAPTAVRRAEQLLGEARDAFGASGALLVVPAWDRFLMRRDIGFGVSVVPLASLEDWLTRRGSSS